MNKWQVLVPMPASPGGILTPTCYWLDINPVEAARAILNKEHVRLIKDKSSYSTYIRYVS